MKNIDIYNIIRHNIKKYRILKDMTQAQLAEKTNLSHDYIRQIESDKVANTFSIQTFFDISVALGIDPGLFFKIDDNNECHKN